MGLFTDSLQLLKQDPGENPNIWGDAHNNQMIELADEAVAGAVDIDMTGISDLTLSDDAGASNESRLMCIVLSGFPPAGTVTVNVPNRQKLYCISNRTPKIISIKPQGGVGANVTFQTVRWVTIDETLNQAFLLEATGRFHVIPIEFMANQDQTTGTITDGGGATTTVYWSFEGSTFAIGWDDLQATVASTSFIMTGAFPSPPERPQSFQLFIEENLHPIGVMDAYATFTTNRIEFFPQDTFNDAWQNGSVRRIRQTWLQYNVAPN